MSNPSTGLELSEVPETMLWTLYGRASEAQRRDAALADPKAVEIYRGVDYKFRRQFGQPQPTFALRSKAFDAALGSFLARNPNGNIVNLGEGLETQRYRVDAPGSRWFTVDLPESIAAREQFIVPDEWHEHIACSATDHRWMERLSSDVPTYISAQGLFMYFDPIAVRELLRAILAHFEHCQIVFDVVPSWVSNASQLAGGLPLNPFYRVPPMPWGVSRYALKPRLRRWLGAGVEIALREFPPYPRGPGRVASQLLPKLPLARQWLPVIVELRSR